MLRRTIVESERYQRKRLEGLVSELIATAEEASAVVAEQTEALHALLAQVDEKARSLSGGDEARSPRPLPPPAAVVKQPEPEPVMQPPEDTTRTNVESEPARWKVYALADAGQDVSAIARRLRRTQTEVAMILGMRGPAEAPREGEGSR